MVRVLVTGGAGFIGHHVVDYLLRNTDYQLTLIDRLDCSGNLNRLAEIGAAKNPRVRFVFHNLRAEINDQLARQIGDHDYILHLAAATHVDRSIENPMEFVQDNIVATCNVLDLARKIGGRMLYFSTDEVFGPAPQEVRYKEWDRYNSGNPYAATKAGAEELCLAYANTYRLDVFITHTMNVIGERQHPEKFVPMTIRKVRNGDVVLIHSNAAKTKPGSRFYIHAQHVASAVHFLMSKAERGEKYNIVGQREVDNLEMARLIAHAQDKELRYELIDFHSSRPGHDLRYALCGDRLADMGWKPPQSLEEAVKDTVTWTLNNRQWLL